MNFWLAMGENGESDREFGIDMYTLLYLKWVANKVLLYSIGNSAQYYVAAWMGRVLGENACMCIYV